MKRVLKFFVEFLLVFILLLIFTNNPKASFSFNISSPSSTLIYSGGQEIQASLNITDLPSESYFRISLQKDTGGSYYGYVQNESNAWTKIQTLSSDCTGYFRVTDLNTQLINLKFKIGEDSLLENGNFNLKAHRFVKTCSSYTEATNSIPFIVSLPTPTPTQVPIPEPTNNPTQTPTKSPSPIPTKSPTAKPLATESPTDKPNINIEPNVLGLNDVSLSTSEPTDLINDKPVENKPRFLAFILFISGVLFLGYGGFLLYNQRHGKS